MHPRVAIVLPFHNAAATLPAAQESLRAQTFADWAAVCVDDGSTDDGAAVVARYADGDPRFRLLRPGRVGLVAALRAGCAEAAATGAPFVARMDADDESHPRRLERQLAVMDADPAVALCGTGVEDFGEPGAGRLRYSAWLNSLASHDDVVRGMLVECPLAHPTFLLRRDALEHAGGFRDNGWPEDYDLVLRLWRAGARFAVAPGGPLLRWRDHGGRLSRTDPRYAPDRFRACKMHHLLRSPLAHDPATGRPRALMQWGAGRDGKAWLREWPGDRSPRRVVDIDPRKIGRTVHGARVVAPDDLGPPDGALLVVVVGVEGARGLIRGWLAPRGWREGADFVFLA